MDAGGAKMKPEEEVSSRRSGSGCDSYKWETSEDEDRTNSKIKLLPDGFLDPLLPQKSSKLPRFSGEMANTTVIPPPSELHPSIAYLRGSHRAAHPDDSILLETSTHLSIACEWRTSCPRFVEGVRRLGLDCIRHLGFMKLDPHLITALVERWSPDTNTFHLPVGEMTITLQDVSLLLGVRVDGGPLIGHSVVGHGGRWPTWPSCCDELLGGHPQEGFQYHDPEAPHISAMFRMGQAKAQTCLPLRWLRWSFSKESYLDLDEQTFAQHLRAYVLYLFGCFLLPDTSGAEVHLQHLPLLEDLEVFSTYSIGGAVLAHLYRELKEATKPSRVNIAGCLYLLQTWSWEHIHVGRPTLKSLYPPALDGKSLAYRWNEHRLRSVRAADINTYRDEFDGLLDSQVLWEPYTIEVMGRLSEHCIAGQDIWMARVPLISWRRVEWHLPERVLRQFGQIPKIDIEPMEAGFVRVDGRGKSSVDWMAYHHRYIGLWDQWRGAVVHQGADDADKSKALRIYMRWYRGWASLYLLKAPREPPTSFGARSLSDRVLRYFFVRVESILQPAFGCKVDYLMPHQDIVELESLCAYVRRNIYISPADIYDDYSTTDDELSQDGEFHSTYDDAGPFTF